MAHIIKNFDEISTQYKAIFCDLWGCIHNGKESFTNSLKALLKYKKNGGVVILLTNAPRPANIITKFIEQLGITENHYDDIVTSGDAAQLSLFTGTYGQNIYHIGPERDLCFFDINSALLENPVNINLVNIAEANCIVCTGLFNDLVEAPDDYRHIVKNGIIRNLKFLCINPDIQVDFGHKRLWCAGSLASSYTQAGGTSVYFGKPHKPIYDLALKKLHVISPLIQASEVICVGDGMLTDIVGGNSYGLDTLFVCGGLAGIETGVITESDSPSDQKLTKFFLTAGLQPTASIGQFR